MKRIKDYSKFRRDQIRASKRSATQRAKIKGRKSGAFVVRPNKRNHTEVVLKAPTEFSLVDNPDDTLQFFYDLSAARWNYDHIHIDLEKVQKLTIDALLLLLSKMGKKRSSKERCKTIGGNEPIDEKVRTVFVQSGFYSHVTERPMGYNSKLNLGVFSKHAGKRVREDICAGVIHFATKAIWGVEKRTEVCIEPSLSAWQIHETTRTLA